MGALVTGNLTLLNLFSVSTISGVFINLIKLTC